LHVKFTDQRYFHIFGNKRDERFRITGIDLTVTAGIRRWTGTDYITAKCVAIDRIGEGDCAIKPRITIIEERLPAGFDAGGQAAIATWQGEQVRFGYFEIGESQGCFAAAEHID
jgi:hypothetical protein